jgi:hypothetical protein
VISSDRVLRSEAGSIERPVGPLRDRVEPRRNGCRTGGVRTAAQPPPAGPPSME